ncbi:MAG: hypothetical protein ACLQAN_01235, partial [Acidimicrobiales bacterium]
MALPVPAAKAAAKLVFISQPGNGVAGSVFSPPPVVAVEDANGNVVTTDLSTVTLSITPSSNLSGASLSSNCTANEFYGVTTFSNCSIDTAGNGYTLTATDGLLTPPTNASSFNITAGPASQLVFTTSPPAATTAGTTFSMVVTEEDAFGNTETNDSTTALSLSWSSGSGGSCTTTPGSYTNGVATYAGCSYTVASTTAYTLTASSTTASGTVLTSAPVTTTVSPGQATQLVFTTAPPVTVSVGMTFSMVVAEEDAYGNIETNDSTTALSLSWSSGSWGSCTTTPHRVTNGVATYTGCSYTVTSTTAYTLTVSSGTLSSAVATTTVYAADGSGTLTTPTANVANGSTGNTITFTYTAASGGVSGGAVTIAVPTGWSAPSTTGTAAGY